ncbi:MAG: 1-deoxy-D-xylulose-5-phosphate reductoisomerase [Acetobacteraceae bacterium]|nr:1-deoxy-D-xylulose-5-phosphate reductoisomerase [Pseudomonadota bacterium]
MPRSISVLGSTGSIGTQTVDLLLADPGRFSVKALVAGSNATLLAEQAITLRAECAVVADESAWPVLRDALAGSGVQAAAGHDAVIAAAAMSADWTMAAITGAAGLAPTLEAVKRGKCVGLANKEALVCAGDVMLRAVKQAGATLLPVDSEHNAVFQSMADGNHGAIEQIVLTASGGPFRTATIEEMRAATLEKALRHPTWTMGAKITIDSATMMNKGLEVIEAARLFGLPESSIAVLVHPQSVIHGMVHYADGSVLAQLGSPDMRIPIAHCLAWPQRIATASRRLNLAEIARLEFFEPDMERFPALRLAREALQAGGGAPTILNAANEIAVDAFLKRRIGFLDIVATVDRVLQQLGTPAVSSLDDVVRLDEAGRQAAQMHVGAIAA